MSPSDLYAERLARRETLLARYERLHGRIGTLRLSLAGACIALAWLSVAGRGWAAPCLAVALSSFLLLVLYHQRVRARRALAQRSVSFHRNGLDRVRGRLHTGGPGGDRFNDAHHVYGADLDLFGEQSLFAQLCTARTPMGERVLARWLLAPADVATIRERQRAIGELRTRLDLREALATVGDTPAIRIEPAAISAWINAPNELPERWLRAAASSLALLAVAAGILWAVRGIAFPLLLVLLIEAALNYTLRHRVQRCVAGIEGAYEDLKLLAALVRRIEAEPFELPMLRALSQRLSSHGSASMTLSKLATLVNFVEARRNPFLTPLMLPLLYTVQAALAAERWRARHGHAVESWLEVVGEIEALQSIAGYSFERPADPFPEFLEGPATFSAIGLGHPLIPAATRICNDVKISGEVRVLLVSGSNMSGKSTLLRSVGMNTVLAMAGAPVCAVHLTLTPLQVGASIRLHDSLAEGSSRFYAEITRLRQLFEPSALPLLFLLDELLQGTNSTDRRIGAQGLVRALLARGAIGCISTHDLALTEGGESLGEALRNVHFQDELHGGKLTFDFKLREGIVTKSNGIELMRAIGLDV